MRPSKGFRSAGLNRTSEIRQFIGSRGEEADKIIRFWTLILLSFHYFAFSVSILVYPVVDVDASGRP